MLFVIGCLLVFVVTALPSTTPVVIKLILWSSAALIIIRQSRENRQRQTINALQNKLREVKINNEVLQTYKAQFERIIEALNEQLRETHTMHNPPRRTPHSCWVTLGIEETRDLKKINEAYRSLIRKAHPDAGGDNTQTKTLNDAVAVARRYAASGRYSYDA